MNAPMNEKAQALVLSFLILLAFYIGLGSFPLFDLDEGAFSAATMEMRIRGDWVTPWLYGEPRFDKPILIYWCQLVATALFGTNEWSLRLPSALAATGWMAALYGFARRYFPGSEWLTVTVASCSLMTLVIARAATADALLNLFLTLTCLSVWRYLDRPTTGRATLTYLWMGLGFLAKGPVAMVIPFVTLLVFTLVSGRWRDMGRALVFLPGWAVFFIVAAPWYYLVYKAQGQAFVEGFFLGHNLGRFTDTMEGHGGSLLYYLPVLLYIALPFTGVLLAVLYKWQHWWKRPVGRFLLVWFAVTFTVFSLSDTQLPHYLLYGMPPLWLLMANYLRLVHNRLVLVVPLLVFALLLLALPFVLESLVATAQDYARLVMLGAIDAFSPTYFVIVQFVLGICVLFLVGGNVLRPHGPLLIGTLSAFCILTTVVPVLAEAQQSPVKQAALFARAAGKNVVTAASNMPSFSVYLGSVTEKRPPETGEWVFTRTDKLEQFDIERLVFQQGTASLFESK
ncbi:glycosyltransferase family 39 protein [Parasalinivibrio latis]|uniref:ArnT family glycosyltransferase n=1 Tax=Parasalinivibrio latis TaxID=2952610 RepID=UPI0030E4679C